MHLRSPEGSPHLQCGAFAAPPHLDKLDATAGLSPANLGFAGRSLGCSGTSRYSAAQVARPRKTSPSTALNDRGLTDGGAGGIRTRTVRIKSPLCYCLTPQLQMMNQRSRRRPSSKKLALAGLGRRLALGRSERALRTPVSDQEPALVRTKLIRGRPRRLTPSRRTAQKFRRALPDGLQKEHTPSSLLRSAGSVVWTAAGFEADLG